MNKRRTVKPTSVYLQREGRTSRYKIGVAACVRRRLMQNQTGNSRYLSNTHEFKFPTRRKAMEFEKAMHLLFKRQNLRGEFFKLGSSDIRLIERLYSHVSKRDSIAKKSRSVNWAALFLSVCIVACMVAILRGCAIP